MNSEILDRRYTPHTIPAGHPVAAERVRSAYTLVGVTLAVLVIAFPLLLVALLLLG